MVEKSITCAQLRELEDAAIVSGVDGYHRLLEDYTGIKTVRHDVYLYYDAEGRYVGDSDNTPLAWMLKRAGVEIKGGEE